MMLSIRRAFCPFRKQGSLKISNRLLCGTGTAREELRTFTFESHFAGFTANGESQFDTSPFLARFFDTSFGSHQLLWVTRGFSSQVGTELEDSVASDKIPGSTAVVDSDNELISWPELSADDTNEIDGTRELLDLSDAEDDDVKKSEGKGESSGFLMSILASSTLSIPQIVENWVKQGNDISRAEYLFAMTGLRFRRRMYVRALQLSEWWMVNIGDLNERDYATHVDLIAKLGGLEKAENFIGKIPEGFRTETVYRRLLANPVSENNLKKSEEVYNKMKNLGFPITCSTYEQLLLLYKRFNKKKKIADVLRLMHQENIKPSPFAYMLLIDAKGLSNDITGMDKVAEMMKNDGIWPDFRSQAKMARHYISAGLQDKAEDMLKQMEESNEKVRRSVILPLYAALGKADDVKRIWSKCESNPSCKDCTCAIEAWGKLQRIDVAEAVFDRMSNKFGKPPSSIYAVMLRVYADNKMLSKGKDLVKQIADNGHRIHSPWFADSLVKLYVEAGELDNAVNVLQKTVQQSRIKPLCRLYKAVMDEYARKGDVHNTEKVFDMMRQAGYICRLSHYQTLVKAYINGKAFAYGMKDRMMADNVFPNETLAAQLVWVDPFRINDLISELLLD